MKIQWQKYNPKDQSTHPKENTRVELKFADGTQFSGGYLGGHFHYSGTATAYTVNQAKQWRYAD
jgi:hypothetical protein